MARQQRGSARQERCNDLLKQKACWRWVIVRPRRLTTERFLDATFRRAMDALWGNCERH